MSGWCRSSRLSSSRRRPCGELVVEGVQCGHFGVADLTDEQVEAGAEGGWVGWWRVGPFEGGHQVRAG